ncbi:hypothetical protein O9G_006370, partial [Rozella allomycis CSF55]
VTTSLSYYIKGSVLASFTILKYDHFPGCQKLTLKDRIDGAPNFRRVTLSLNSLRLDDISHSTSIESLHRSNSFKLDSKCSYVYGVGMPTLDGIKKTLLLCHCGPNNNRSIKWTCLREEPELFVKE